MRFATVETILSDAADENSTVAFRAGNTNFFRIQFVRNVAPAVDTIRNSFVDHGFDCMTLRPRYWVTVITHISPMVSSK